MKRKLAFCAAALCLTLALAPTALAAELGDVEVCYPTAVTRSEDGTELRKIYELGPEDDPAGIPRSDVEQDGFHYTLVDLLQQGLPEYEEKQHTETVSLQSPGKDMATILELLPQEKEFVTEDGYTGTVSKINLNTVRYVAIFEGTPLQPVESSKPASFNWAVILVPIGVVALAGVGTGAALFIRRRREAEPAEEAEA